MSGRLVTLRWRTGEPLLLGGALTAVADDVALATRVSDAEAAVEVPDGTASLRLTLTFTSNLVQPSAEVLRIDQLLSGTNLVTPRSVFEPVAYELQVGAAKKRMRVPGLHPLLAGVFGGWSDAVTILVRVPLVDVTGLIPSFLDLMEHLAPRAGGGGLASSPRILARTDGILPRFWIVATPESCRGAAATDVLAFFGPSQNHGAPLSLSDELVKARPLREYGAVMLGAGTHDDGGHLEKRARALDHFAVPGEYILAKGLEKALVASGRNAILTVPVPANRSHNRAATSALPGLLTDIHRVVTATGDAHPPVNPAVPDECLTPVAAPHFAVGAHSRGGLALWGEPDAGRTGALAPSTQTPGALSAGPNAYTDLLLFEAQQVSGHLDQLARTGSTRVVFVGYERGTVSAPFAAAQAIPGLKDRVQRFPVAPAGGSAPEDATLLELADRSPSLTHALSTLDPVDLPTDPVRFFEMKHQLCTWSGDRVGLSNGPELHFLTQVLLKSGLR